MNQTSVLIAMDKSSDPIFLNSLLTRKKFTPSSVGALRTKSLFGSLDKVLHLPIEMSDSGSVATILPKIPKGNDGAQTSALDQAKQLLFQCFLQAFQYLTTFGQSKLKLESLSRGIWSKDNSTTRHYR
jgi:hypothetical protein